MDTPAISRRRLDAWRWNARADTPTSIVMWMLGTAAVLICALWLVRTMSPAHLVMDRIQSDLDTLQMKVSEACNSNQYLARYNPITEEGNLTLHDDELCIRSRGVNLCAYLSCSTKLDSTFDLKAVTYLVLQKTNDIFTASTE